ncbi:uncharacterized protein LOC117104332 [Anneissia japonica]|uniref:uncharacterized protein LOC117104332 n=1 Tax=Anneissia japonica TaxID=1529436 RepID=UPI0014258533|nr:uncharacterized protein LOC117104332 [Anneissia japonica]
MDLKIRRVQKPLIKGIVAMTRALGHRTEDPVTQETMALLANANYEILVLRKDLLKLEINRRYAHLCKATHKPNEYLFGDLGKTVKLLDDERKAILGLFAANSSQQYKHSTRYSPYPNPAFQNRGKHFLAPRGRRPAASSTAVHQQKAYHQKNWVQNQNKHQKRLSGEQ